MPILGVLSLPVPPGWDLFSETVRRGYVDALAARGFRVDWPTGQEDQ